jgi:lysophospholipase L1-like esterase
MSDLQSKCSRPSGFDVNHEGHSGWQAYDIARNNIVGWAQSSKPDIVQFMLGTNDVNIGKRNVQTILDSYTTIVNALRAANPNVKIIVCRNLDDAIFALR